MADVADVLARLGSESVTERRVRRIVPWVVSGAVHLGLIAIGFLVTWTVVVLQRDEPAPVIVADFESVAYEPLVRLEAPQEESVVEDRVQDHAPTETPDEAIRDAADLAVDPLSLLSDAARRADLAPFAPRPPRVSATFVGISSTNARRVVYVIDASGSMIRSLPIVLDELERSVAGLQPGQEFAALFFSRNEAIIVPPVGRLVPATEEFRRRTLTWIRANVIPAGRSNPVAALRYALGLEPDVIFLLSENITGSGEFEIDQADLLAILDEANPRDATTGRRRTRINCVQFLDPDPLGTLERIALEHGGADGYKFLDRAELGLGAR